MPELSLKERFALIALNAQDSIYMTQAKKAALRCISAAGIFDKYIGKEWPSADELANELKDATDLSSRELKKLEKEVKFSLEIKLLLSEIPNLMGCDMNYVTASVNIYEYCTAFEEYTRQTEGLRAELMEEGHIDEETICLLWLLRESSCFYDLFTKAEQEHLSGRITELYINAPLAKALFPIQIHKGFEAFSNAFLKKKKELFTTPFGTGLLFVCPFLERSQSIFIEADAWFSNDEKRLETIIERLNQQQHTVQVLRKGQVPLIKVDNLYFECVPTQVVSRLPIQGSRLRRYIM